MKHLSANMPPPRRKARIEIIPLIDIMFFLLASFMLISLSMIKPSGHGDDAAVEKPRRHRSPISQNLRW